MNDDAYKEFSEETSGIDKDKAVWKLDFARSCLQIYGAPMSPQDCLDKEEHYYFSYCSICLAMAMKENDDILSAYMESDLEIEDAAYCFAEFYENQDGDTLIPLYKNASVAYEDWSEPIGDT